MYTWREFCGDSTSKVNKHRHYEIYSTGNIICTEFEQSRSLLLLLYWHWTVLDWFCPAGSIMKAIFLFHNSRRNINWSQILLINCLSSADESLFPSLLPLGIVLHTLRAKESTTIWLTRRCCFVLIHYAVVTSLQSSLGHLMWKLFAVYKVYDWRSTADVSYISIYLTHLSCCFTWRKLNYLYWFQKLPLVLEKWPNYATQGVICFIETPNNCQGHKKSLFMFSLFFENIFVCWAALAGVIKK